jgi:hypothetical protein
LAAVQVSAEWRIFATIAPSTAASRSASSKTMNGALPPSSMTVLRTRSAQRCSRIRPTSVDPVNDSMRVGRWATQASNQSEELVVGMMLTSPSGSAGLEQQLADPQRGEGGLRRRLDDHGVAGRRGPAPACG